MQRRVLGVDRQQQASSPLLRRERKLAGRDEALLVRERERHSALERPERRFDACEPDDRVQHDIRLRGSEQLGQVTADLRMRDASRSGKLGEIGRGRRERAELQLRAPIDDVDRLTADRAGCAEERYTPHGASVRRLA